MAEHPQDISPATRYGCVGCLTFVAGAFGGGLMAVLIAKIVGSARKCEPPEGLPACDWHVYAAVGMLIGAVLLPVLVIRQIRKGEKAAGNSR
jgi:hypothetical protein